MLKFRRNMAFLKHKQALHGILYHRNHVSTAAREEKPFILFKKQLLSLPTEPALFWRDMKAPRLALHRYCLFIPSAIWKDPSAYYRSILQSTLEKIHHYSLWFSLIRILSTDFSSYFLEWDTKIHTHVRWWRMIMFTQEKKLFCDSCIPISILGLYLYLKSLIICTLL